MRYFIVTISLAAAFTFARDSAASYLTCAEELADGIQFAEWHYSGGPAPLPGLVVERGRAHYRNTFLGSWERKEGEMDFAPSLLVRFDEKNKRVILEAGPMDARTEVYVIPLSIRRSDGKDVLPGVSELTQTVSCLRRTELFP